MRRFVSLFLILSLLVLGSAAQNLKLPISNYTNKTYGRTYESTNYCIVTDHRNLVYAGNANGILEYDGSQWRFIPVRQGAHVTSLDVSPRGRIYVGSQQEFGYLDVDPTGSLRYLSLSDRLPETDRFFSTIWFTHAGEDFTVFQAAESLYLFKDDSLTAVWPETSFHTSFLIDNQLYVRERENGLKVLRDGRFIAVPDGELFADLGIFGMFPFPGKEKILIVTNEKGFYLFDPLRGIEHLSTNNDQFLIQAGIFGGISLRENTIALNSMHEGVIVCSPEGNILTVINKHSGLQDDDVKGLWQDAHQNIWCALGNGIGKIDYSSPVSFYHENAGLEGSVHSLIRYGGKLFVGTTSGLYSEHVTSSVNKSLEFIPWPGIRDQVWCLESIDGRLLAGTSNGLYVIHKQKARKISDKNVFKLLYLEKEKLLLAGGSGGLSAFNLSGNLNLVRDFPDLFLDIKSMAINNSSPNDATEIWLGTSLQGAVKILLAADLSYDLTHYFGMNDGLPVDWVHPFSCGDSIVFGTHIGAMHFVDEIILRNMLPDSLRDKPENYRGYFESAIMFEGKENLPLSSLVYSPDRIWAVIDNEIAMVNPDNPGDIIEKPFRSIDLGELNSVYPDGENTVWFGASDGLARFDLQYLDKPAGPFNAVIRSVILTGDSLLFNGSYSLPEDYSGIEPENKIPAIDYNYNDLTFFFASPFYDNENRNRFSWMLEGGNSGWTGWSDRLVTSYTNLHEGEYTFLLRSKNIYGDITVPTGFSFIIRPPWYRTIPAYIVYVIFLSLFLYSAVRMGQMQLRRKNERLEAIVQERTEEIRHQNIELAAQKKEITDSIYYAERIQRAILPSTEKIAGRIAEYFILFKPKDIVSGDFYWLAENRDKIIVTAADCTGHGVPGAFMSMLGVSFLNKIVLENNITRADRILNELRDNVISALKQTGKEGEARDGMDMALVVIDLDQMTMEFAGANNPLYLIREDELKETKADRMPIAYHFETGKFSNHKIQLRKGDAFYMFSDGYADQFGGPKGKKFMYKAFKRLLLENSGKPMHEIHQILEDRLESWIAPEGPDGVVFEQVDDILVIGVRI